MRGLIPDLAEFWARYLIAARDSGEIHQDTDIAEAAEWMAREVLSLATVPGDTLDRRDADAVARHARRYIMAGLRADGRRRDLGALGRAERSTRAEIGR